MLLCPAHPVIVLFELYFYFIFFSLVLPSPWFFKPPDYSFAVFQPPPPPPPAIASCASCACMQGLGMTSLWSSTLVATFKALTSEYYKGFY